MCVYVCVLEGRRETKERERNEGKIGIKMERQGDQEREKGEMRREEMNGNKKKRQKKVRELLQLHRSQSSIMQIYYTSVCVGRSPRSRFH